MKLLSTNYVPYTLYFIDCFLILITPILQMTLDEG